MPTSHQSSVPAESQPNILLIEEYDALAAAIGAALKKFAPHHATRVAKSLADAESLALNNQFDLLIIDFDPSFSGLTAFLQKMRKTHSEARVLVISTGVTPEIATESGFFGALQFIPKPYDVADFGTAVQTLLGQPDSIGSAESRGMLRSLNLPDIVALQCAGERTVIIDLNGTGGDSGVVHILNGQIIHAEVDGQTGRDALEAMFAWANPRLRETPQRISTPRTIHGPWVNIFLETCRNSKPAEKISDEKQRPKTGKKIVIVDDTEMLLVFVEDVLTTADQELQITKARNGTDALEQIRGVMPDVVLLDYSLPDINGDEVCLRLLQDEQTSRIPVLMMSGHVAEMSAAAAHYENIFDTLEKPFLSNALVEVVQRLLSAGAHPVKKKVIEPPAPSRLTQPPQEKQELPKSVERALPSIPVGAPLPAETVARPAIPQQGRIISAPIASGEPNEVVLRLFLEVLSMQLTPQLRMGTIRARPASSTVSLHFVSTAAQNALPTDIGFQLGATELDEQGRLAIVRLIPTAKPFHPAEMRSAFEIGGVALVPGETRTRVQLTPAGTTPMIMELCARLELGGVALSSTFQVSHLILKWRTSTVRITLDPKAREQTGAAFHAAVKLNHLGRIAELVLNPIK